MANNDDDIDTIKLQFQRELSVGTGSFLVNTFLKADYAIREGDDDAARKTLRQAMMLAKGHSLAFLDWLHPEMVGRLINKALEWGIETEFATRLMNRYQQRQAQTSDEIHVDPVMRVYTLGNFSVVINGEPIRFTGKAQQRPLDLLKVVIAFGARGVSKEKVSEALWPDAEGDQAHRSFATNLHRLRKLVGKDRIVLTEGKLHLPHSQTWVDVREFDEILTRASVADDVSIMFRDLEQALSLYNGNFMQEEEHSWAIARREQLRGKLLTILTQCGSSLRESGEYDKAILLFRRALEVDELAEAAYQGLLLIYRAQERRAEVISTYLQCRKILSEVLGVAPSPETEAIYMSVQGKA